MLQPRFCIVMLAAAFALAFAPSALAHKPVVVNGGPTDASTAYEVADPDVSQVGYHHAMPGQPELWFTFQASAGQQLYLQLGVPEIERYEGLRSAMVLLGPGLPDVETPFAVPAGYGGIVYDMVDTEPIVFDEEFTGTVSWQFPAQEPIVDQAGTYYLVGYLPRDEEGKFWIAVGVEEKFGLMDILTLPGVLFGVRAFHEVQPFGGILFWAMMAVFAIITFLLALR